MEINECELDESSSKAEIVKPVEVADVIARTKGLGVSARKPPGVTARADQPRTAMPLQERMEAIARLTEKVIDLPMFQNCSTIIASMHVARRINVRTPRGVLITGLTGSGKSTIAKGYLEDYPRYEGDDRTIIPVLYVELPSQPTAKAIAERMLVAMGDPFSERGSTEQKLHRIRRLLVECRVELIMLDEFQHITDRLDDRARDIAGDMLKNMMNETNIPFVFLGGPSCRSYFLVNPQLGRRCSPKIDLAPFGVATSDQRREFQKLMKALDERLPFQGSSALVDVKFARRLWMASFGLVGQLTQLVGAALDIALSAGAPSLNIEHLSCGFSQSIYQGCPRSRNPFERSFDNMPLTQAGEPFHGFVA